MSHGEYMKWERAKRIYQERIDRALKSNNPIKSLDRIREDIMEAFDLMDPNNFEILTFYKHVEHLMLEQEVA